MRLFISLLSVFVFVSGCTGGNDPGEQVSPGSAESEVTESGLGLRPDGDTEIAPDMSQVSDELAEIFQYIDDHFEEDVRDFQRWIQQPSISNTGEGIPESARMVRGFFDELGCDAAVHEVGETEWGAQGNPVVYAKCDEGADKTLLMYWMYDNMPITQPDLWNYPPFEGVIVEQPPFPKVLIGRGATNSKGGNQVRLNALRAIKAVTGKLPMNLIVVAEGDEERMSIGLRKFVKENQELFADADEMWSGGRQSYTGRSGLSNGSSEGCVYIELTTSGAKWGRGPVYGDIHGGRKRAVDSPAWRHMQMLESIIDENGNIARVEGFYDDIEPLSAGTVASLKERAKGFDMEAAARNLGVARFISDDPFEHLKMASFGMWGDSAKQNYVETQYPVPACTRRN